MEGFKGKMHNSLLNIIQLLPHKVDFLLIFELCIAGILNMDAYE